VRPHALGSFFSAGRLARSKNILARQLATAGLSMRRPTVILTFCKRVGKIGWTWGLLFFIGVVSFPVVAHLAERETDEADHH
jgi:hypothetical protein